MVQGSSYSVDTIFNTSYNKPKHYSNPQTAIMISTQTAVLNTKHKTIEKEHFWYNCETVVAYNCSKEQTTYKESLVY